MAERGLVPRAAETTQVGKVVDGLVVIVIGGANNARPADVVGGEELFVLELLRLHGVPPRGTR